MRLCSFSQVASRFLPWRRRDFSSTTIATVPNFSSKSGVSERRNQLEPRFPVTPGVPIEIFENGFPPSFFRLKLTHFDRRSWRARFSYSDTNESV
jgi:hypothetical protein